MHYFVHAANLSVLLLLVIVGKNLIRSSLNSVDLISGCSLHGLYHFDGL